MPEQLPLMLVLLILLLFSKVFGELFERVGIPALTGEILGGLLLGPTVLGLVGDSKEIRAIADLGVLMLIVMAGLEIRSSEVRTALKGRNIWTAILGFVVPGAGGYFLGNLFGFNPLFNIFLGLCLAISALPVSIRILMDLGKLHTDIGQLIISTAIINDILSLLFLGVMLDVKDSSVFSSAFTGVLLKNLAKVVIFMSVLVLIYRVFRIARNRVGIVSPKLNHFMKLLKGRESLFAICMIFVLAFSGLAEAMGLHFVIGAFFGAILIPRELFPAEDFDKVKKTTQGVTMGFLAPIFFAYIGVLINVQSLANIALLLLVLLIVTVGKTFSGYIGGRITGMSRIKSITLGIGMNTKGIMELVIANIAYQKGFIDISMFTILVVVAIITTVGTPFLLKRSFRMVDKAESASTGSTVV
jgi:Kef-type K+ transport system membrane component KefB